MTNCRPTIITLRPAWRRAFNIMQAESLVTNHHESLSMTHAQLMDVNRDKEKYSRVQQLAVQYRPVGLHYSSTPCCMAERWAYRSKTGSDRFQSTVHLNLRRTMLSLLSLSVSKLTSLNIPPPADPELCCAYCR